MIKKDLFVQTINFIRDRNDAMYRLNDVFSAEFEESVFYPYFKYDEQMLKVLAASFDYDDELMYDWISYYCFELDFGRKHELGCVTKDVVPIPLETPEELYDMLWEDACSYEKGS